MASKRFILNIYFPIYLLILISLLNYINSHNPNVFTLSNDKIVIVSEEGIHFYTAKMIEEEEKRIIFKSIILSENKEDKITFNQFSKIDEEYVIISVINKIYFFDKEGNLINYTYLSDSLKDFDYSLIPYKKENNFLHYIIFYPSKNKESFIINHFKFSINFPYSNQIISSKIIKIIEEREYTEISRPNLTKINCNFMFDENIYRDILVCFYIISFTKIEIQSKSLDPKEDFNEISKYFNKYEIKNTDFHFPNYISIITNEDKRKTLIYLINGYPYMLIFELGKSFNELIKIIDINIFNIGYSQHKLFELKKNNENLIISSIKYDFCKLYIIYLNSNFDIKYKAIIDQDIRCENINSYSSFINGTIYKITNDQNVYQLKNLNKKTRQLTLNSNKCLTESEESKIFNLCLSCNNDNDYYQAETPKNISYDQSFIECYKKGENITNFYFSNDNKFKPCYETCSLCFGEGDENNNNCITCADHYRKNPKVENDCVVSCEFFYYYTFYGQYKCSKGSNCPEEAPFYIFELKKCTDDCSQEEKYKFQYGGRCYDDCPYSTILYDGKICKDNVNDENCKLSIVPMELQGNSLIDTVDVAGKSFAEEFNYFNKHVSYYLNNEFSIVLYQRYECIQELKLDITNFEIGDCYSKLKQNLGLNENQDIIVALLERKNEKGKSISIFYLYDPRNGQRIDTISICEDANVVVKKNVKEELNNTDLDYDSMIYLTEQNIDIFNLSGEFYTDICFNFESPNGKDVPLKDRIKSFYPNISLCEDECISKGVNLATMESICECKLSGILNNDLITGNALLENTFGDVADFITNSNLDVLKCYQDVFNSKNFKKNTGGIIILAILGIQIVLGILFFLISINHIKTYLNNLSEFFSTLIIFRNKGKKDDLETREKIEKKGKKEKMKVKFLDIEYPPLRKDDKEKSKKKNKGIRETEQKELKRPIISAKSPNKLDNSDDYAINIKSQKNLDRTYRDKIIKSKFNKNLRNNTYKEEKIEKDQISIIEFKKDNNIKKYIDKEIKKIQEKYGVNEEDYLKADFDDMDFDDAIKYDKRPFCEYFCDKFKENQIIMNTFFNKENLKPITIKAILLLLNIELYFVINGFFYSESYISELFHSDEEEKFFSYLHRSISRFFYTTVVGVIVSTLMDCILIEEKKVKRVFKREKENHIEVKNEISKIFKSIKINYIIFMVICFFISLFSWYYVCCFNSAYPGVKVEWIKSSITIMIIMQILSFLAGLIVSIIRLISFTFKSEKLYKLKDFFN